MNKQLLAKWQSKRGRYFVELYAEFDSHGLDLLPGYSYRADGAGGYIGTVSPDIAMQHAARQASYAPSKMERTFYSETVAAECCRLWQKELMARQTNPVRV